ncbi:MAG: 50S ribosomal protein L4 [Dehalococcoidales bacterium]|nr:50S ribosomal protein L4 [Dehalococcoidales bacterium]
MQVPVYNASGEELRKIKISDAVFGVPFNEAVVHQVMVGMQANARQGTASAKTRAEVVGSTKKLYRQKGTGSARSGSKKSPLRRGGGVTFGPKPRDYRQSLPKKLRRLALRCVLSSKAGEGDLKIVDTLEFKEAKTKQMLAVLDALQIESSALIVTQKAEENIILSSRNIPQIATTPANVMNIIDIMSHKTLLMTEAAVRAAEELWSNGAKQEVKDASL